MRSREVCGNESGQALILALGGALGLIAAALALVAIAGAVTGKGRAQRAADLVAISAVRSMRDDLDRLLSPPRLADGQPNPNHIEKATYLARARAAALAVASANDLDPKRVDLRFPDADSFAPVRAKATIVAGLREGGGQRVEASAVAEAAAPYGPAGGAATGMATGGGYSGPLIYRDGEGMRPDVAAAYDQMAAAARVDGLSLIVVSGFRSDAEQAELFAAHPDPTWVAPPGHSLHRCATELDLGPSSAYGWLAANATRFGFVQRYSWESRPVTIGSRLGGAAGSTSRPSAARVARSQSVWAASGARTGVMPTPPPSWALAASPMPLSWRAWPGSNGVSTNEAKTSRSRSLRTRRSPLPSLSRAATAARSSLKK